MLKMQQWWFRAWVGRVRVLPYRGHDADLRKLAMTIFGRMKAIPGLSGADPGRAGHTPTASVYADHACLNMPGQTFRTLRLAPHARPEAVGSVVGKA